MVVFDGGEPEDVDLPLDRVGVPVGLDFDPGTGILYWVDLIGDRINSFNFLVSDCT